MSARIPPGYAEAWMQFVLTSDPQPMYTAIGLDLAVGVGASQAAADAITLAMRSVIDNLVSQDYTVGGGYVLFGQDGDDIRIDSLNTLVAGASAQSAVPQNTAWLLQKRTALGGRRNRGRMFIPGLGEPNVSANGALVAGAVIAGNAAGAALINDLTGLAEVEGLVLLHDTAPFLPTPITGIVCAPVCATQRRRMRR